MENEQKKSKRQAAAPADAESQETKEAKEPIEPEAEKKAEQAPKAETQTPDPAAQADELKEARAQAEEFKKKWYLVAAEYENYRRRTTGQSAQRYLEGRADVVSKLFPVGDALELAIASCAEEATRRGIELVQKAFFKILEEEKITVIDPVGQPFDAEECEAIMAVDPAGDEESGTVKSVYRKGYAQNGKILRFAQVVVVK